MKVPRKPYSRSMGIATDKCVGCESSNRMLRAARRPWNHLSIVALSPYITHRRPDLWDNPERFDPERFTPERVAARPRFAYWPFAGGPRAGIGKSFALFEAQIALATIAQRYRFVAAPGAATVVPEALVTLRPRNGLPMLRKRLN